MEWKIALIIIVFSIGCFMLVETVILQSTPTIFVLRMEMDNNTYDSMKMMNNTYYLEQYGRKANCTEAPFVHCIQGEI